MTADELLAAIYDDPFDLELRRVYGDRLLELGDPRGEFIQLQLARSPATAVRERELLDRHAGAWLGPIAAIAETFTFERGFLHACVVPAHRKPYNVARVAGHPAWSTVEILEAPSEIYLHPTLRSLRSLTVARPEGLVELCTGEPRPLRELACALSRRHPPHYADAPRMPPLDVFRASSLPALETLDVDGLREPAELDGLPAISSTVQRLVLRDVRIDPDPAWVYARRPHRFAAWLEHVQRSLRVPIVELVEHRRRWTLHYGEHGYAELVVDDPVWFPSEPLPLQRVEVVLSDPRFDTPDVHRWLARFPAHAIRMMRKP